MEEPTQELTPMLHPDGTVDERMTAFQVWALLADRSPVRTSRILEEEFGIEVKPNTISQWKIRDDWELEARALFEAEAPSLFERTRAALVAAGPPAANYLRDVVSEAKEADRNKIVAAAAVLDRIGFLPFTRREAEKGATPVSSRVTGDEYADMSPEELRAIVAGRVADMEKEL